MNYAEHYDRLITRAVGRSKEDAVFERHHIVPKCLGGSNDKSNLCLLTPEEHYVAHQLLVKIYPGKKGLSYACVMMASNRWGHRGTNKLYGWIRRRVSEATKEQMAQVSDAYRQRMSVSLKKARAERPEAWEGKANPELLRTRSLEKWQDPAYIAKRAAAFAKPEVKAKRSAAMKVAANRPEHKARMQAIMPEANKKRSASLKAYYASATPEQRAQKSASMKAAHARRRDLNR
jgi:hypothetical protein